MATSESGHAPSRVYHDQQGNVHLNGSNLYSGADGSELPFAQVLTITPAAGAANVCNVTFQVQDAQGNALAQVFELSIWLSDDPGGNGLTATTPSGATGQGSAGTELLQKVSKKSFDAITDATGKYVLQITDNAKTGFFPAVLCPGTGITFVGAQLQTANYG
jgi:hypothetical protein